MTYNIITNREKTNSELDQRRTNILEQKAKPLEENVIKTASAPSLQLPLSFLVSAGQLVSLSAPPATAFQALFGILLQRHHPVPQL